jgi:predicted  nucleic acid-binding Zn-ribbon protein
MEERNPFIKRPIDVANDEIRNLKKEILKLKSEITTIKTHINPMRDEYLKKKTEEEEKDKEIVMVADTGTKGWFW